MITKIISVTFLFITKMISVIFLFIILLYIPCYFYTWTPILQLLYLSMPDACFRATELLQQLKPWFMLLKRILSGRNYSFEEIWITFPWTNHYSWEESICWVVYLIRDLRKVSVPKSCFINYGYKIFVKIEQ